jgi:hypothetical protein
LYLFAHWSSFLPGICYRTEKPTSIRQHNVYPCPFRGCEKPYLSDLEQARRDRRASAISLIKGNTSLGSEISPCTRPVPACPTTLAAADPPLSTIDPSLSQERGSGSIAFGSPGFRNEAKRSGKAHPSVPKVSYRTIRATTGTAGDSWDESIP